MRKSKIITIDGRGEITLKEVSPLAVYTAWSEPDRLRALEALVSDAVSPPVAEIKAWYPSEIEAVLTAFLEVNNSFFGIARTLRLEGLLNEMIRAVSGTFPSAFADSFRTAMSTPGITAGRSL